MEIEKLNATFQQVFPYEIAPGSIADRLLKEGRQEGIVAGKIQALQQVLGEPETHFDVLLSKPMGELIELVNSLQDRIRKQELP